MKKVIVGNSGVIVSDGKAHYIDVLPDGYTRLQYISMSGKSAVDTGIVVAQTDTILVTYELSDLTKTGDKFICSCKAGYSGGGLWFETYGNTNKWYVRFGSASSVNVNNDIFVSGKHTGELKKGSFKIDGTTVLSPTYSSMPSTTLNIGGRIQTDGVSVVGMYGSLYEAKILDGNGEPRWWGVPVKNSNNVPGFYDMVGDQFHPSVSSSNPFTAGPEA